MPADYQQRTPIAEVQGLDRPWPSGKGPCYHDELPLVVPDLPEADYHAGPGISKSGLDKIARSPAHYIADQEAEDSETQSWYMLTGKAQHCAVLEPSRFPQAYVGELDRADYPEALVTQDHLKAHLEACGEKTSGRKTELVERVEAVDPDAVIWDRLVEAHAAKNQGKEFLRAEDWKTALEMQKAVWANRATRELLGTGQAEESFFWIDEATGVLCKVRTDFRRTDNIIVDYKVTDDARPHTWIKKAYDFRYHVQAAWYMEGIQRATGQAVPAFIWLVQERKPPYAVAPYYATQEQIELGWAKARTDLATYAKCLEFDHWPAYDLTLQPLGLPGFAKKELEEEGLR